MSRFNFEKFCSVAVGIFQNNHPVSVLLSVLKDDGGKITVSAFPCSAVLFKYKYVLAKKNKNYIKDEWYIWFLVNTA